MTPGRTLFPAAPARSQAGFSLVELLVVMVLGILIMLGLIRLFSDTKQGYRTQDAQARLQENARYGLDALSHALRLADFWGSAGATGYNTPRGNRVSVDASAPAAYTGAPGNCTAAWFPAPTTGLMGYQGTSAAIPPALTGCLGSTGNYVPKSDAVAVRYADPDIYATTAQLKASQRAGVWLRAQAGGGAMLFNAGTAAGVTAATTGIQTPRTLAAPAYADQQDGVFNYKFQPQLFFLRTCGDLSTGTCSATSDYGLPKPNLCVLHSASTGAAGSAEAIVTDCLVENVEQLKIAYGIDTNADDVVDQYAQASAITTAQWPQVITARVMMVVRGDRQDNAFPDTFTYSLLGLSYTPGDTDTFVPASTVRSYARRVFVREVQLRNRVRR